MPAAQNDQPGDTPTDAPTDAPTLDMEACRASVSRVIAADPQRLFDVVADPSMHHVIDGSGSVKGTRSASRKLALGDRFTENMRLGVPYMISNKVVELDEPRLIAWSHIGGWRWRYGFEPVEGGTRVTETFDWSSAAGGPLGRAYVEKVGWPRRNVPNMARTLERLDAYLTNKHQEV
jgi:hypothetical protein